MVPKCPQGGTQCRGRGETQVDEAVRERLLKPDGAILKSLAGVMVLLIIAAGPWDFSEALVVIPLVKRAWRQDCYRTGAKQAGGGRRLSG